MHAETPDGRLVPYTNAEIGILIHGGSYHLFLTDMFNRRVEIVFSGTENEASKAFDNLIKKLKNKDTRLIEQKDITKGV